MNETYLKLVDIIAEQLDLDEEDITEDANFTKDLEADSLDVIELVMAIEEEFNITIDDETAGNIETVQDLVDFIEQYY